MSGRSARFRFEDLNRYRGRAPALDELKQFVQVIALVSSHSPGERAREAGFQELLAAPLNDRLQNWALRGHLPFRLRLLCHLLFRTSRANGLQPAAEPG